MPLVTLDWKMPEWKISCACFLHFITCGKALFFGCLCKRFVLLFYLESHSRKPVNFQRIHARVRLNEIKYLRNCSWFCFCLMVRSHSLFVDWRLVELSQWQYLTPASFVLKTKSAFDQNSVRINTVFLFRTHFDAMCLLKQSRSLRKFHAIRFGYSFIRYHIHRHAHVVSYDVLLLKLVV